MRAFGGKISVEIHVSENQIIHSFHVIIVKLVMTIQLSVYVCYEYVFIPILDSFPFKIKNSHIKLCSVAKAYLKPLVYVSVVTMKQSRGGLAWGQGRE